MAPYDECKPRTAEGSRPMDMKILAIVLLVVSFVIFKEPVTWNKVAGIGVCMAGLVLINYK